jgi:hypothetical protein
MTSLYLAFALCFVSAGLYVVIFQAPHWPMPVNPDRRFTLITLSKPRLTQEKDSHVPWWFNVILICVIFAGELWPLVGFTILGVGALVMLGIFIDKEGITIKSVRLKYWRFKLRCRCKEWQSIRDEYDCGYTLARSMSCRLVEAEDRLNEAIRKCKAIDSRCQLEEFKP